MALTTIETPESPSEKPEEFAPPPAVVITPCDPWPRPYYLEGGLRRVAPYHYTYNTHCKERWRGREIIDIFASEFRDRPIEYYVSLAALSHLPHAILTNVQQSAIETGNVTLDGKKIPSIHTKILNGQLLSHTLHRHEPPVAAQPIGIVHEDNDMIVINKPAGVPVHPAGRYNYNSLMEIIRADRGHGFNPMPCNRLDRLTSGIMFVGKNRSAAEALSVQIQSRTVKKEYIARVIGNFPDGEVICEQPILQISPKLGLNRVRANGKEARTVFRKLAYYPPAGTGRQEQRGSNFDGNDETGMPWKQKQGYSIVRCLPLTGRTHQLRVHLQFLGHPISNDPIYCNQRVFGQSLGKGDADGETDDDILTRLARMGKEDMADAVAYHDELVDDYNKKKGEKMTGEICDVCQTPLYHDPGLHELGIYLHSRKYACAQGKWEYETPLPQWALPPTGMSGPCEATPESDPLTSDIAKLSLEQDAS